MELKKEIVDYLITTVGKTKKDIINIIQQSNIRGRVIVGNQKSTKDCAEIFNIGNTEVILINSVGSGVSKNRNNLLNNSNAKYVTFLDDDVHFVGDNQKYVENVLSTSSCDCIRFNVVSNNQDRPIKQINRNKYLKFKDVTSFGVWGEFFSTDVLKKKSLLFREEMGPGTPIDHGEDTVFNREFLKTNEIYQVNKVVFEIDQQESTWQGKNRNIDRELKSFGYLYYLLYKKFSFAAAVAFLVKHFKMYPKTYKFKKRISLMKSGIKASKDYEKQKKTR